MMGKENVLGTDVVVHIALVVNDIEKTSQAYANFFGIEVPKAQWTPPYEESRVELRGKPVEARALHCFFKIGNLEVELIQPDEHPSIWREHLEKHGEGFHHIALVVNGLKHIIADMESKQMPLLQRGEYQGGRYAYMDTVDELKLMIELLEND